MQALSSRAPGRLEIIDLLLENGLDRKQALLPTLLKPDALTPTGLQNARALYEHSNYGAQSELVLRLGTHLTGDKNLDLWDSMTACLYRSSQGLQAIEVAALLGDAELVAHLRGKGMAFPARPLECRWASSHGRGSARVSFADGQAHVLAGAVGR